jgi:hypothetical protein
MGRLSFVFKKPRLTFNKSSHGSQGFAFHFGEKSNSTTRYDHFKIRHFNAFGTPTQSEVIKTFSNKTGPFAQDLDLGEKMKTILNAKNAQRSIVQIEISSSQDGVAYQYDYQWESFRKKLSSI